MTALASVPTGVGGWRVFFTRRDLPVLGDPMVFISGLPPDLKGWLDEADIPDATPFLMSPSLEYDVDLNGFFHSAVMLGSPHNTQAGYARDLAQFLTFLWLARGRRRWRDTVEDDHLAYWHWRRRDPGGPRVAGSTWDREVAAVNQFFNWAVRRGHLAENPLPQRLRRPAPVEAGHQRGRHTGGTTPATYSHDAVRERVQWLPPDSYRRWRDVGLRGFTPAGLPDERFRGRWSARNACFADLMVRTGLRLSEQCSLTISEVPFMASITGFQRFWLPAAIAKAGSARWVYTPVSVVRELCGYVTIDRADIVARARESGRYRSIKRPLVIENPDRPVVTRIGQHGSLHKVKLAQLRPEERRLVLIATERGLEPAAFWLSEHGAPMAPATWKSIFTEANTRCRRHGLDLYCHAHMLRHTFAVVTLEQLQRGHIVALAELNAEQRGHYTRIFGDPLDWVRRRLGHRSLTSTMIYLHALAELEMHTRMALVPDGWEHLEEIAEAEMADPQAAGDR